MDIIKQTEKDYHDVHYSNVPLPLIDVEDLRKTRLVSCCEGGFHRRTDNLAAFHKIIAEEWKGKILLDYVCGNGGWATYFAIDGAKEVFGFDISESAIRSGKERLEIQDLSHKLHLEVKDATQLDYPDDNFEIAIGHGVLHHVIKYPNIFEELYRVMKPNTKAYFLEGLADFPLWKLWWKIKGQVPIAFVVAGLLALAFMGFAGLV